MKATVLIRETGEVVAGGTPNRVPWWSFTKTALAIAALRLYEQGKIDLDTLLPGKPYTPVHLLRHESGLPDYGSLKSYHADVEAGRLPWPVDDLLSAVESERLRFAPGEDWAYSNVGYREVVRLIETSSGRPLADNLVDFVFVPAGLASARLASTPNDLEDVEMGDSVGYHPGWVYHGLVVGTATDAARLLHALLGGKLLAPQTFARMSERRSLPQFQSELHPDPAYGLGLMLSATDPFAHPVGHSGGGPGSRIAVYARGGRTGAVWADLQSDIDPEADVFSSLRSDNR